MRNVLLGIAVVLLIVYGFWVMRRLDGFLNSGDASTKRKGRGR